MFVGGDKGGYAAFLDDVYWLSLREEPRLSYPYYASIELFVLEY